MYHHQLGQAPGQGQKIVPTFTTVEEGLTERSWPFEAITSPVGVRPPQSRTVNLMQELVINTTDQWLTVVSLTPSSAEEGFALEFAGAEVGAAGTDLQWRITLDGSTPANYNTLLGGWSTLDSPVEIITPFVSLKTTALQVYAPAAGGAPRTVRGLIRGWIASWPPTGPVIAKLRGSVT